MKDPLSKKDADYLKGFQEWKKQSGLHTDSVVKGLNGKRGRNESSDLFSVKNEDYQWETISESSLPVTVMKSLFEKAPGTLDNEAESLKEKQFSKVLELSPAMIIITDRWGEFEYANPMFLNTVGYSRKEVIGRGPGFLSSDITSSDKFYELEEAILKGTTWKGELIKRKRNGAKFIFSASLSPVENNAGLITNFIIVGQDVTPFRETQEKLRKALEEKNVLLSELHHRVKNNLAVVSGLMQLQAFNEEDQRVQNKLFSSAGRIKAMSSMHELLYESKSLKRIQFNSVIEKVVQHVSGMFRKEKDIELKWNLEQVELNINQAHPSTLIVYEVISNAYKHAFDCEDTGLIEIKLYSRANMVFVSVTDDGKGMPMDYHKLGKIESTTGYELLNSLNNQLGGHFTYESDMSGTNFFLQFEKEDTRGISNAHLPD